MALKILKNNFLTRNLLLVLILFLSTMGCSKKDIPLPDHPGGQLFSGLLKPAIRCFRCHGTQGEGTSRAPALVKSGKTISVEKFTETVLKGKDRMPRFEGAITEEEIGQIMDWLQKVPPL
ncbi:MAG: cytochrome c [Nitrospira sp.]|nr:cytochrome c [Candidatus Manganitrophaceae bacterium]HIL35603.1 cytochrome c [Candidatus Manganitrophaceae bacterium]